MSDCLTLVCLQLECIASEFLAYGALRALRDYFRTYIS